MQRLEIRTNDGPEPLDRHFCSARAVTPNRVEACCSVRSASGSRLISRSFKMGCSGALFIRLSSMWRDSRTLTKQRSVKKAETQTLFRGLHPSEYVSDQAVEIPVLNVLQAAGAKRNA